MGNIYYINRLEKEQLLNSDQIDQSLTGLIQKATDQNCSELLIRISRKADPDQFQNSIATLKSIGFTTRQQKSVYTLDKDHPLIDVPDRLTFQALTKDDLPLLRKLFIAALENTLDRDDDTLMKHSGPEAVADDYFSDLEDHYDFDYSQWDLGINRNGNVIGYTLPVYFKKKDQNQIGEGTFLQIATLPEHRGNGYVFDLLKKGTRTLQEAGFTRIYSDTDHNNFPMRNAFKKGGYTEEDFVEILGFKRPPH